MSKLIDLSGAKFGRWTVLEKAQKHPGNKKTYWKCKCDCGTVKDVDSFILRNGCSKSCGCLQKDIARKIANKKLHKPVHGDSRTRLYSIWRSMKERCYNEAHMHYKHYGGKGIHVCDEWKNSFPSFKKWAIENGYNDGLSIDRIDNNHGYFPENCRWIPLKDQPKNRCTNHFVSVNGERLTVSDCARKYGIAISTVRYLDDKGKDISTYVPRTKEHHDTKHQCRWCNNLVTGNGIYCTVKKKEKSENSTKQVNHCKHFEFNEIDAYNMDHKYHPKRQMPRDSANTQIEGQMSIEDYLEGGM